MDQRGYMWIVCVHCMFEHIMGVCGWWVCVECVCVCALCVYVYNGCVCNMFVCVQ